MITQTHTVRGKKRGREKSRESDTACQTKKGRVKEEEAQQFSLKKTVEGRSFWEAAGEPMEVEIGRSRRSVTRPAEAEKEMDQMVVRGSGSVCRERSESDEERRKQMWSVRGQREEASTKAPSYTLSSFVARHVKERSPEEDAERRRRRGDQRRANQKRREGWVRRMERVSSPMVGSEGWNRKPKRPWLSPRGHRLYVLSPSLIPFRPHPLSLSRRRMSYLPPRLPPLLHLSPLPLPPLRVPLAGHLPLTPLLIFPQPFPLLLLLCLFPPLLHI